jgi:uncharacterized protein (DUF3084 family)
VSDDETIGELYDRLPKDKWVDLPEYGVSVQAWSLAEVPIERTPFGGESTSAALARVERERDEARFDLARAVANRRLAVEHRNTADRESYLARAELASAQQELDALRTARDQLVRDLAQARAERSTE